MHVKCWSRGKLTNDEDKEILEKLIRNHFLSRTYWRKSCCFFNEEHFADVISEEGILDLSLSKTYNDDLLTSVSVYGSENLFISNRFDKQKRKANES